MPSGGKRKHASTGFRHADPAGRRHALDFARDRSQDALAAKGATTDGWGWVGDWLKVRFRNSPLTLQGESIRWSQVSAYLDSVKIVGPEQISYKHAEDYIAWRTAQVKRASKRHPTYNTALQEVRFLSRVMREAVRRGQIHTSPLERLSLRKDPPAEKPEMTDDEIAQIRARLPEYADWMTPCFEIAIHQGCRLKETSVPFSRINIAARTIQFHAKRGKIFTTRLHANLVPLLTAIKATGAKETCLLPRMPGKEWHWFFKGRAERGRAPFLPHLCFHCTRVSVVTRLARAGVPIQQAMAYVGHANELIHRIYQRLKPADVGLAEAAIQV